MAAQIKDSKSNEQYHILFVSLYNTIAQGLRTLVEILKGQGYRTSIIYLKDFAGPDTKNVSSEEYRLFADKVAELSPDLIGLSSTSSLCNEAFYETAKILNNRFPGIPLIAGGASITTAPEHERYLENCDFLFMGEADTTIIDIVRTFQSGGATKELAGSVYKEDTGIKKNDLCMLSANIDKENLPDLGNDGKFLITNNEILNVEPAKLRSEYGTSASIGCPYRCSYCCNVMLRKLYSGKGKVIRVRSVQNIIEELRYVKEVLKDLRLIRFWDDVFPDDKAWIEEFCAEYKRVIDLPFAIWTHPLRVKNDHLNPLVKAGLHTVVMGIQHGSARVRKDVYLRSETDDEIVRAAKILHDSGLPEPVYDLILDSPFETLEDLEATYDLFKQLPKPFKLQFHSLMVMPGTEIEKMLIDQGLSSRAELEEYRKKPLEEQFSAMLYWEINEKNSGRTEAHAYWKKRIYDLQFEIENPFVRQRIEALETAIEEQKRSIESLQNDLRTVSLELKGMEGITESLNSLRSEWDNVKPATTGCGDEVHRRSASPDRTLETIYQSRGWKLLLLCYRVRDAILPVNSRRREIGKKIFKYFARAE